MIRSLYTNNFLIIDDFKYKDESGFYYDFGRVKLYFLKDNPYSSSLMKALCYCEYPHDLFHFQIIEEYNMRCFETIKEFKVFLVKIQNIYSKNLDVKETIENLKIKYE